jgi:GNAT superfamily N-acetyltransferase
MHTIRDAVLDDLDDVYALIRELAAYEQAPDSVTLTLAQFKVDFFIGDPPFQILVVDVEGQIVGMALYYFTYSTWRGRCLYLEDMIITEAYRRKGLGKALFEEIMAIAANEEVERMAWQVLDWNTPAIRFYQQYNAWLEEEWLSGKLTGERIQKWASEPQKPST